MNANEVIANRAAELRGESIGDRVVHPNDHVNFGQSSNDVIPTAMHVAAVEALRKDLIPALTTLEETLQRKASAFDTVIKPGERTCRTQHRFVSDRSSMGIELKSLTVSSALRRASGIYLS